MTTLILLGFMRRLNGRKTQSCRSIAIDDKVTALITPQIKVLVIQTLHGHIRCSVVYSEDYLRWPSLSEKAKPSRMRKFHSPPDWRIENVEPCAGLDPFLECNKSGASCEFKQNGD